MSEVRSALMLFDGVCNLCSAAVQWVVDHDPDGEIHFASLQSEAARHALEAAEVDPDTVPDSIVLVDAMGVHVRSAAALRIFGHLGFPLALLQVLWFIPRPLRDSIYAWVARNRYGWFGRTETCMVPTPELAARFLDAAEDRPPIPDAGLVDQPSRARAWGPRFAIAYVIVYMAPFPLTLIGLPLQFLSGIPVVGAVFGAVLGLHGMIVTPVSIWIGELVFDREVSAVGTGSGDMTFNYADLILDTIIALLISVVWTARRRATQVSPKTRDVARTLARYYLATTMLTYGWLKLFPLQFSLPGPDRLIQPYGDSSPMGLAWTFLGASLGYQMFAGLAELIGGYLLMWRRTALLGALVSAAVMTNVMAINFFYDVPVKLFSSHLVLMAVFIAWPELPRLGAFFALDTTLVPARAKPFWERPGRSRRKVIGWHAVLVGLVTLLNVLPAFIASANRGVMATADPLVAIYRVESFAQDGLADRQLEDHDRWVRVGLNTFVATIQRASGDAVRMRVALDKEAMTVSFFDRGGAPPESPQFNYTEPEPGLLELTGTFEGKPTTLRMRRDEAGALLTERGFRWINEFPFNR